MIEVDVRIADNRWRAALGDDPAAFVERTLSAAAQAEHAKGQVSALLADDGELQALNHTHRGVDKPTNVLAFPAPVAASAPDSRFWGDLALAFETAEAEARAAGKAFSAHAAHLLTHGFLHLLGYDHENESDAERMEGRERVILAALGVDDPYASEHV